MLLSFSIENFRSFREEQTLSMVASNRHPDHIDHLSSIPDSEEKLVSLALIYGANGAGKSNLVKALVFAHDLIVNGTPPGKGIPRQPFLLSSIKAGQPSSFNFRFIREGWVFDYGFKISDKEVLEESLFLLRGNREVVLFERITKPDGTVLVEAGDSLKGDSFGNHDKVVALTKVGVRANQLFLAGVRASLEATSYGPLFQAALNWFASIQVIEPEANFQQLAEWVAKNSNFSEFAGNFLRDAATGVNALRVETTEIKPGEGGLPPEFLRAFMADAKSGEVRTLPIGSGGEMIAERGEDMKVRFRTISAEHPLVEGGLMTLPFEEESDGTQRLTHLLPALFHLQQEQRVYVIDEIDRSLHPLLARKFVEFFLRACKGKGSQIIITTHESNLMDLELLRRDELWFAEKNPEGASTLYSLSDFKVRTDLKIDRGYLNGRFGAIPFLGNLDRLLEQTNAEESCP